MSGAPQLSFARKLGYGVGDFGFNLFFTTATLYLLYYYTDVLGLPPSTAGWVFAAALIWDAVFDPVMGYVANRTRTRWGRYRPYLLLGGIPLALSWSLIFLPVRFEGTALVLFAASAHMLFRTLYAVVSMPYLALSAVMTSDSEERGVLAGVRMVSAATCGLLSALFTLALVKAFGGGSTGFFWTAVLYGILASVIFLIVFASTRETAADPAEKAPSPREMLGMLAANRAFWIVCAAMLAASIGGTFFQKSIPYFFKYSLAREDLIGPALATMTAALTLSIPLWTAFMKRTSKRLMWMTGASIGVCGQLTLWFGSETPGFILPVLALLGIAAGAGYLGFWSMMPDTVEYGEWRTGIRSEGAVFGIVSLIQKGALGLAAGALGELLDRIGYRANETQTPETLAALKTVMVGGPILFGVIAVAAIAFYPIDGRLHRRLVRVLEARRRRSELAR